MSPRTRSISACAILGLAAFAAVLAAWHRDASFSSLQLLFYATAVILLPVGLSVLDGAPARLIAEAGPRWSQTDTLLLAIILVPATILRLINIDGVPLVVFSDEISYLYSTLALLQGNLVSPFASGPWDSLYLHMYTIAAAYYITPSMTSAARLVSVIPAILAIGLEYLLLRKLFGRALAFPACALMCLCAWNILIARYGYHWAINQLTELLAVYWLVSAMRTGRLRHYAFAGYGLGFGVLYTYSATLLPIGFVLYFVYLGLVHRHLLTRQAVVGWVFLVLAAGIVAAPRLTIALADPGTLSYHRAVSVTNLPLQRMIDVATHQYGEILVAFNYKSDEDIRAHTRGTGPLLDPIMATLLGMGAFLALLSARKPTWALLVCAGFSLLLPAALSYGQTVIATSWRASGAVPFLCTFAAAPFEVLWRLGKGPKARQALLSAFAVLCILLGAINCRYYFVDFPGNPVWQTTNMLTQTWAADRLLAAPPRNRLLANGDLFDNVYIETLTYGRRTFERVDWPDKTPFPTLLTDRVRPTTVIASGQLDNSDQTGGSILMQELGYYYPCGSVDGRRNSIGETLVRAFSASVACIRSAHGLQARYEAIQAVQYTDSTSWHHSPTGRFPFQVSLQGSVLIPTEGIYRMTLGGVASYTLTLDGTPMVSRYLLPGMYNLVVTATVPAPTQAALLWSTDASPLHPVPLSDLLIRPLPSWGLLARYTFVDGRVLTQWTPSTMYDGSNAPYSIKPLRQIEFRGQLWLPTNGVYQFALQSASYATLTLGMAQVIGPPDRSANWLSTWFFSAGLGWHQFDLVARHLQVRDLKYHWIDPNNQYGLLGGISTRWPLAGNL